MLRKIDSGNLDLVKLLRTLRRACVQTVVDPHPSSEMISLDESTIYLDCANPAKMESLDVTDRLYEFYREERHEAQYE